MGGHQDFEGQDPDCTCISVPRLKQTFPTGDRCFQGRVGCRTDNNPLTYILTMLNLDATGHRWVGALASFEYQKGADNGVVDALSRVPICHNHKTVRSLLEGTIVGGS